jgi:formate-dependent nitrite reductase membrane component NrfD
MIFIALLLVNLATGAKPQIEAAAKLMGGSYTVAFWGVFVTLGLLLPLLLEYFEIRGSLRRLALLAPVLVLVGGYVLRVIAIDLGQETTWTHYASEFNTQLLDRLH